MSRVNVVSISIPNVTQNVVLSAATVSINSEIMEHYALVPVSQCH